MNINDHRHELFKSLADGELFDGDDVTANWDEHRRAAYTADIRGLDDENVAVVCALHELIELVQAADRGKGFGDDVFDFEFER